MSLPQLPGSDKPSFIQYEQPKPSLVMEVVRFAMAGLMLLMTVCTLINYFCSLTP